MRILPAFAVVLTPLLLLAACPAQPGSSADAGVPNDDNNNDDVIWPDGACAAPLDDFGRDPQLLRFEATDPPVRVHLVREYAGQGVGESSLFALRRFSVEQGDSCATTDDAAALSYENSHHNWLDIAHVELEGTSYALRIEYVFDGDARYWRGWLTGEDAASGDVVLAERELIPTGGPLGCWECPAQLPVWILEVLPENDGGNSDEAGEAEPWVELWNPSGDDVDLSGWQLVARGSASGSWTLPEGTVLPRHRTMLVWLDGEPEDGPLHASFTFPATGGQLLLRDPSGVTVGERTFSSPGAGSSLDYSFAEGGYVSAEPTPDATSPRQE